MAPGAGDREEAAEGLLGDDAQEEPAVEAVELALEICGAMKGSSVSRTSSYSAST